MEMPSDRYINFAAGPSQLPEAILKECQSVMLNYNNSGQSILELSHRGEEFKTILAKAKESLRLLLDVPSTHEILFMQGGGTGQFSALPLNLCETKDAKADYLVTGSWSLKAYQEALKFCDASIACNGFNSVDHTSRHVVQEIPSAKDWKLRKGSKYMYYCDNETIHGIEFPSPPSVDSDTILVCDMSSNFLSKPINIAKFGVVFAGAQKNCGIPGVTIIITRKDLMDQKKERAVPVVLDYEVCCQEITSRSGSTYNTPPTFAIYVAGLVFQYLLDKGGINEIENVNNEKAAMLYSFLDRSKYYTTSVEAKFRSRMNAVFNLPKKDEDYFFTEARKRGLIGLKGHRSVGGCRASLYNVISLEDVEKLVSFLKDFEENKS